MSPSAPIHAKISGPIVMIGFGSIGKGTLPLIERHFDYDKSRITVIDPKDEGRKAHCDKHNVRFIQKGVTKDNYRELLMPLLTEGGGQGFCVNLSVDTSSVDIMTCAARSARSISTPSSSRGSASISIRRRARKRAPTTRCAKRRWPPRRHDPGGRRPQSPPAAPIPAWCLGSSSRRCSTSPRDTKLNAPKPKSRKAGAGLVRQARRQGHPHRRARHPALQEAEAELNVFVNTWSVEGFVSEGVQPAELGWGTHEKWMPENGREPTRLAAAPRSICCSPAPTRACAPGARRRGAQYGFLVTHNEFDLDRRLLHRARRPGTVVYRPTCHYAYHPANDAVLSLHEMFGAAGKMQPKWPHPRRERDRGRHRRTRRAAVTATTRTPTGTARSSRSRKPASSRPTRTPPACRCRRRCSAGMVWALENPERRHRRSRRDGFPSLPRNPDAVSRPGEGFLHRLDAAHRPARDCFRRISTRRIRGSSGTCWCGERRHSVVTRA